MSAMMSPPVPRRRFLGLSLTAAAAALAKPLALAAAEIKRPTGVDRLTAYQLGPHIWVRWANHLLTSYRAHPTQKYPYLYPLTGPSSGLSLTSESAEPWPHHRSLLFGCDRVNGGNYWQEGLERGQIISAGPRLTVSSPESCEIQDECQWKQPDQPVVMRDERKITIAVPSPQLRLLDFQIRWIAVQDVEIPRTNHALFAIRAAEDITPWGGGTLVNSAGQSGEKATFGQPAAWCAFFGRRQGMAKEIVEGVAILDHPQNPWAPSSWFTRDYGFISPSPFNFLAPDKPWRLPAGESVALRYRAVLFAGDPQQAKLDDMYRAWSNG